MAKKGAKKHKKVHKVKASHSGASSSSSSSLSSTTKEVPNATPPSIALGTFFSGLETPSIALVQAGLSHKLLFAVEINGHLRTLVKSTWHCDEVHEDVTKVDATKLPTVNIMVGGPPCQPYCRGGKNQGLKDERGPLTFSMVEAVEERSKAGKSLPKAIVMEQAKTLLCGHRNIYKAIKKRFKKLDYKVRAQVLNTNLNGVPQSRERAYVVAYKPMNGRKFRFPSTCKSTIPLKHILHRKTAKVKSASCNTNMNKLRIKQAISYISHSRHPACMAQVTKHVL